MGATTPADQAAKQKTLFTNFHVFDGGHEERIENANVLIEGKLIKQISAQKIEADGAMVIDGLGNFLDQIRGKAFLFHFNYLCHFNFPFSPTVTRTKPHPPMKRQT